MIEELFKEVISGAKSGEVLLDGETWPIAFSTRLPNEEYKENDFFPLLVINDPELFYYLLDKYVNLTLESGRKLPRIKEEKELKKFIISYLFVNATTEDFLNPIGLLNKEINFLKDETLNNYNNVTIELEDKLEGTSLVINKEKQSIYMETPYKMTFKFENDSNYDDYNLAEISYGISNNTCYIYSMMKEPDKSDSDYYKKINRYLYKLNKGIYGQESNEFKDYKEGKSDYYPENISDVSMPFVLSLSVFLNILEREGIDKVKVVSYLPLRYLSRDIMVNGNEEKEERNNQIQRNATEKLIRTFRRVAAQTNGVEVDSLPYELDEYLTLNLYKNLTFENEVLETVNRTI